MSISSSIRNPNKNSYIQLYAWQVIFCKGNHCAALLLAYFIGWHDWKIRNDKYYRRSNDIAEMHNDGRPHNENAYLFFSTEQLIDGCMGIYGKKAITDGLDRLIALKVITVHKNPNPRYHFDKTKHFQFYPQVCNRWIASNYPLDEESDANTTQTDDKYDSPKMPNRETEKVLLSSQNSQPSSKSSQAITDTTNNTTNNTTNKNESINACENLNDGENAYNDLAQSPTQRVIDTLKAAGMQGDRLQHPDDVALVNQLIDRGATASQFEHAYALSVKSTIGRGKQFRMRYLSKVVEDLMLRGKPQPAPKNARTSHENNPQYENDFRGGLDWMGDFVAAEVE